ncbi:lactonase family protein [Tichowtungia aerotolerans]|uniref:Beta-propeller fold lactonase family protein n=1 Tax=Tichowtungia aerotolerans TaxID=2697043 RepID=A0A6P1MCW2_9BACT|nr:lactonase family protein [Tichowtungia aerotolerans]QHI70414.1 beta-propeller fold lactonase family protein [Tichowtungia aerotolerans]
MKTNSSCASVLAAGMIANASSSDLFRVYFGTQAKGAQRGIYMALFDAKTGKLEEPVHVSDSIRPGFVVIHPDGQYLYATDAAGSFTGGTSHFVSSYRIEEPSGILTDLNTQAVGTGGPCHISLSPDSRFLLAADYRGACCATLPILENFEIGEPTAVREHSGSGPNPKRQEKAHTHSFNGSPDGKFALAADLGIDQILSYRFDDGDLTLFGETPTAPGAGPRHLVFHPNGQFAYVSMELNGTVSAYEYSDGTLTEIQTCTTLPGNFAGDNTVSEVQITPDGRFLYVGNRGHESLAIFAVDPESGKLTALGHESTRGKHPRHFNIDPSGRFLIAANMHSDNVVVFRIDPETGKLDFTGSEISVPAPSCVQFFSI